MKTIHASNLLSSLGNELRLTIYRMLIKAGSEGLIAKEISTKLAIQPNKLSFHLNHLKSLELIYSNKSGREISYFANYEKMNNLIDFLFDKCCIESNDATCMPNYKKCND